MKYPSLFEQFNQWTSIPCEQWQAFESKLYERSFQKGEYFLQAGDQELEFGIIISGIFRCYYADQEGHEQIKAFRKSGELLGPYAEMLLNIPSRTYIQAMENCQMVVIRQQDFFPFYTQHLCWQILGRLVAEKHFLEKEQREYEFLQLDALGRYEQFCEQYGSLVGKIPQHQIASYLGITPVALSRILSRSRQSNS